MSTIWYIGSDGLEYPLEIEDTPQPYNPSIIVMSGEVDNYGRDRYNAYNVLARLVHCMHIMSIQVSFRYY